MTSDDDFAAYQPSRCALGWACQPECAARRLSRRSSKSEGGLFADCPMPHPIAADLTILGLQTGDTVLVRSAARAIKVASGSPATALFDGILETIGPSGTLVALAFTPDFYFWQKRQAAQFPFHPRAKSDTGAFAQIVLDHPGSVRSKHPTNSFVAFGPNAGAIVRGHDETATAFYPIKNLIDAGGKLLLVGCVESSPGFSTVHRVQEDLGLADRTLMSRKRICAVQEGDHLRWFERRDVSGCSAGFWQVLPPLRSRGNPAQRDGRRRHFPFCRCSGGVPDRTRDPGERPDRGLLRRSALYVVRSVYLFAGADDAVLSFRAAEGRASYRKKNGMIAYTHIVASIDPDHAVPLAGRAGGARVTSDVHDFLEANILAIFEAGACRAVFISIDAVFVGRELSDALLKVCSDFGVNPQSVLIVASHTHSAPALENTKPLLGQRCDDHFARVRDALVQAVRSALGSKPQNAILRKGHATVSASINRRLPRILPQLTGQGLLFEKTIMAPNVDGPVDRRITALVLEGESTAVVWHYTCHPSGFPAGLKISADYPGVVRNVLRQRFGRDAAVIFLPGFAGDIRPLSAASPGGILPRLRQIAQGPCFHDMSIEGWLGWSATVSDGVMRAIGSARPVDDVAAASGRISSTALDALMVGADRKRAVEIQHLGALGEKFLAINAEPLLGLRELCPANSLLVGYSRDVFGYWPRDVQITQGGYEVNGFKPWFGVPHPWRSSLDQVFAGLVAKG